MKMKVIIALGMIAYVLAEPPVGDSYSHHDHHDQRSLSQEYGPPAFGSRSNPGYPQPSEEYGVPGLRSQRPSARLSQEYGVPKAPSQIYGAPTARDISRQYLPATRSQGFKSGQELSQEYGIPEARNIAKNAQDLSQEYGVPELRSLSDTITVPSVPSDSYGAPLQRSQDIPSEQYGVPKSFGSKPQSFRSAVSQTYGVPRSSYSSSSKYNSASRSQSKISEAYGAPARSLSTQYGTPSSNFRSSFQKSPSETYGVPNERSLSTQYGAPSSNFRSSFQKSPSETYGVPNERSLSTEYGVPSKSANTNAFVSSYDSARSSPSPKYGAPTRVSMPSEQYGAPEFNSLLSGQGYSYARNALDELLNQEPANYDFGYKVNDLDSGSDFGHTETRQENRAEGSYFVVLPDGSKQVVEYEADERGFKPRISVEPAESKGYDDNASDIARSGPY